MNPEKKYMQRCLQLAANGLGSTYPNPLVGCVIVLDDIIIGEGWHYKAGQPHAEVLAINHAKNQGFTAAHFERAVLYVNLEPCSHHGKTPPCADLVINSGFKKVIIGTLDPHEKVAGNGVKKLNTAGIKTTVGILEAACNEVNKRFFMFHKKQRPYIVLKWAQTSDYFIAPLTNNEQKPVWITNQYARQHAHKGRAQEHAILIGANTAITDNPSLTTRNWRGADAQRFVISNGNLPEYLRLFLHGTPATVIKQHEPETILQELAALGIQSVIIEGGAKTLQAFIDHNLWDEAQQYSSSTVTFTDGIPAPLLTRNFKRTARIFLKGNALNTYRNR
jgi:diaminohydroxyphosphoribosylaminopyrimidine deaminase/5-amino-6-(5-phosphoribosylamino)uracil reductase